jgi:hypothetical protein
VRLVYTRRVPAQRVVLLLVFIGGCSNVPAECELPDEEVTTSFALDPPMEFFSSSDCTVAAIGDYRLNCADPTSSTGTTTVTLRVAADPAFTPDLHVADSVEFTYVDRRHIIIQQYFRVRRGGQLILAGQRSPGLNARWTTSESAFYSPLSVSEAALACDTDSGECARSTRVGLTFSGAGESFILYDGQMKISDKWTVWLSRARENSATNRCTDVAPSQFKFIISANPT